MKSVLMAAAATVAVALGSYAAQGAAITPGDVLVYRVGDGTTDPLANSNAAAVSIVEYTPGGSVVQTISMPSTGTSAFTETGNSVSSGQLQFSQDGQYLLFPGYRRDAGLSAPDAVSATTVNRLFARVNLAGVVDASTAATVPNQVRSVASVDGSQFWISDGSGSPRFLAYQGTGNGAVLTNSISGTVVTRQVSVYDSSLYASITSSNPGSGLYTFNPSLPTTGTGTTVTQIIPGGTFQSFFAADLDPGVAGVDTIWAAETAGGTINKYSKVGGVWVANGTIASGGVQDLTGLVSGNTVTFYGSQFGKVSSFVDSAGYNATNNGTVADIPGFTPGTAFAFKGIAVAVPEPTGLALVGLASVGLFGRRRRSN